jgi:hypothetical protein
MGPRRPALAPKIPSGTSCRRTPGWARQTRSCLRLPVSLPRQSDCAPCRKAIRHRRAHRQSEVRVTSRPVAGWHSGRCSPFHSGHCWAYRRIHRRLLQCSEPASPRAPVRWSSLAARSSPERSSTTTSPALHCCWVDHWCHYCRTRLPGRRRRRRRMTIPAFGSVDGCAASCSLSVVVWTSPHRIYRSATTFKRRWARRNKYVIKPAWAQFPASELPHGIATGCHTDAMTSNDVYQRLGQLEQLVQYLYEKTGVPMPDLQTLARTQVSDRVRAAGRRRQQDGRHQGLPRRDQRGPRHREPDHRVALTLAASPN